MAKEIKIRIKDYKEAEALLKYQGAEFDKEIYVVDTYYDSSPGKVVKVTEDETGNYLVELESKDGGFSIVRNEKVDDINKVKKDLEAKHGVKRVMRKVRRFFNFPDFSVNINLIEGVGDFLILEGDDVDEATVKELGFEDPEYITVAFSEL